MDISQAKDIHALMVDGNWAKASGYVDTNLLGKKEPVVRTHTKSMAFLRGLLQHLLDEENYLVAASMLWGGEMFTPEPESVQRVFKALHENAKVLFMGASSMGKTYSAGAWMYLDWRRDPLYTSIKCVGVSEDQVRKHVFAHIAKLHRSAALTMAEDVIVRDSDMWMGIKEGGNEFGITAIAYKQSQETSGGIKGYKSMPVRPKAHPKFGFMSRLRLLGDEGQNWPNGPWKDLNTWLSQIDGTEGVKIAVAFNPEDVSRLVVEMSEPEDGWNENDVDTLYDYTSKAGWRVCRLDAAKCENVIQKKKVYQGLQTYEGYVGYLRAGGDNSANFWCFARGFPPMKGSVNTIIPVNWPQEQKGEAVFIETPTTMASVDLAFMGQDSAQMAVARWGLASGWKDYTGKEITFVDRLNVSQNRPRHVLQIDQILPMVKHDNTVKMAEEIMGRCTMMNIQPEWVVVDKTSIGLGVFSHLSTVWGAVHGIAWNEGATDGKILAEDREPASSQCEGIMSELWWAFRRWLDPRCSAIIINPMIPSQPLLSQLTGRRFGNGKKGIKVEAKDAFKAHNSGKSPDEADAVIMLVGLVRKNSEVLPGLVEQTQPRRKPDVQKDMKFVKVKDMVSIDEPDSIASEESIEGPLD